MNQPRFPDLDRSGAVLIGVSHFYSAEPGLPAIPTVQANLTALRQMLINADTGVLRAEWCHVLADPSSVEEVGSELSAMAAVATDLLLVYYAGHGLVDERGRLHLALAHTQPQRARWTALPIDLLREEIATSTATTRVLVLDCCFSGRAIEAMSDDHGVITGQLDVAGTYTLTSTTANAPAHAPAGDRYTAFTGALLRALSATTPLTLDQIYLAVGRDLASRNLPHPQRHAINAAGDLVLSRGPTATPSPQLTEPHIDQKTSDSARFTRKSPLVGPLLPLLAIIPAFAMMMLISAGISDDVVLSIIFGIIGGMCLLFSIPIVSFIIYIYSKASRTRADEVVIDRFGITVRGERKVYLAWGDIALIGVARPDLDAFTKSYITAVSVTGNRDMQTHVLVVRLRPGIPPDSFVSVLSEEHRQFGYLGLCSLNGLVSSSQEMISTLERFAGSKLVYGSRQFLDRDPRLRPGMM